MRGCGSVVGPHHARVCRMAAGRLGALADCADHLRRQPAAQVDFRRSDAASLLLQHVDEMGGLRRVKA